MSMMECAHCGRAWEGRNMRPCAECGAMVCPDCQQAQGCPEGPVPGGPQPLS